MSCGAFLHVCPTNFSVPETLFSSFKYLIELRSSMNEGSGLVTVPSQHGDLKLDPTEQPLLQMIVHVDCARSGHRFNARNFKYAFMNSLF